MQTPRVSVPEVGVAKVTSVRTYVRACNQDVLLQYARARRYIRIHRQARRNYFDVMCSQNNNGMVRLHKKKQNKLNL